jgi:hypothetical protein
MRWEKVMRTSTVESVLGVLLIVLIAFLTMFSQQLTNGAEPNVQRIEAGCRAILEDNFQACNDENVKALIKTCSRYTGTREEGLEFMQEAQSMFDETDVYMRLTGFKLIKVEGPFAYAYVNQLTLPAAQKDAPRTGNAELSGYFRHNSGLLPKWQEVQYLQKFHFDAGKWKVHRLVSEPVRVEAGVDLDAKTAPVQISSPRSNCPNGKCSMPFVTVR